MATKRPAPHIHPSRQTQVPREADEGPRRKKQKPDYVKPNKTFKKAHPVNELKSHIRSLKRLLTKDDRLPADVRVEKERALRTAQHELEEAGKAKQRSEVIAKYHKVRFFDRQNAAKRLKRAKKELAGLQGEGDGKAELERRIHDLEVDVNYAQYYPLDTEYVPLYPRKKTKPEGEEDESGDESQQRQRQGDPEMWQRVKQCMEGGRLDALRNGRLLKPQNESDQITSTKPVKKSRQQESGVNKLATGTLSVQMDGGMEGSDDESDGGFFE